MEPSWRTHATHRKQQVVDLLKSLETKDPVPFAYVNPNKYIQHNLQSGLVRRASRPHQEHAARCVRQYIRVFEDAIMFRSHGVQLLRTTHRIRHLRFEDGLIVEHWDNLQETATEPAERTHDDRRSTIASDLDKTEANKALMQRYMQTFSQGSETFPSYFNGTNTSSTTLGSPIQSLSDCGFASLAAKVRRSYTRACTRYLRR